MSCGIYLRTISPEMLKIYILGVFIKWLKITAAFSTGQRVNTWSIHWPIVTPLCGVWSKTANRLLLTKWWYTLLPELAKSGSHAIEWIKSSRCWQISERWEFQTHVLRLSFCTISGCKTSYHLKNRGVRINFPKKNQIYQKPLRGLRDINMIVQAIMSWNSWNW